MTDSYVELHCHSCFSFREGASTPAELVLAARSLGYGALALTDHDNLAGAMEFAQVAKEWGVRSIIGAEITLRGVTLPSPLVGEGPGVRVDGVATPSTHLTLLAETQRGYANISRLISYAHLSSPRDEPALDPEALRDCAEGVIALSGCRDGEISRLIEAGDFDAARIVAARYADIFGARSFFIELQNNLVRGDRARNRGLADLARTLGLGVVATNNVHCHDRARHRLQDVLALPADRRAL